MTSAALCEPHGCIELWDEMWDSMHPLNAKRTRSKGYGVSMADASSAILPRTVAEGAPQDPRPGAHPFGPSPAAVHGTVPTPVAQKKFSPNLEFYRGTI